MSQAALISDLLTWYAEHRAEIAAALPLRYQGTTRTRLEPLDRDIAIYRAGGFRSRAAYCYVRRPLERLKAAFEVYSKEVESGK
jgi:hypothetical protein